MRESIRLGRIAGIRVGMNWSVLFIVALIWVGLSGARFPIEYPDESTITYVLAGAVAAIVFIVSCSPTSSATHCWHGATASR